MLSCSIFFLEYSSIKQLQDSFIHRFSQLSASFTLFLFLPALSPPINNNIFDHVLCADISKTATQRSLFSGQLVRFYVKASGEAVLVCTATLSGASTSGETSLRGRLQIQDLTYSVEPNQVFIGVPRF